jgi:hypothetical protein
MLELLLLPVMVLLLLLLLLLLLPPPPPLVLGVAGARVGAPLKGHTPTPAAVAVLQSLSQPASSCSGWLAVGKPCASTGHLGVGPCPVNGHALIVQVALHCCLNEE